MEIWEIEAIHPSGDKLVSTDITDHTVKITKEQFRRARLAELRMLYNQVITGDKEPSHARLVESARMGAWKIHNEDRQGR